jgi:hypothetical protein
MVSRHNSVSNHSLFPIPPRTVLSDFALAFRALSLMPPPEILAREQRLKQTTRHSRVENNSGFVRQMRDSQQSRRPRNEPTALPVRPNNGGKAAQQVTLRTVSGSDLKSIRPAQLRSSGIFWTMCLTHSPHRIEVRMSDPARVQGLAPTPLPPPQQLLLPPG